LEQLQAAMESAPNKRSYIRLAAMRCLLRGMNRADVADIFCLLFDGVDSAVFQCWLDELAQSIPANDGVRRLLVLDNASWHKVKTLHWHHFEPLFLPPYSPDFNPIERLWLRMKADFFTDWIARNSADQEDRLCAALNHFMAHPHQTASICSFRK
jgi:hypothetical protein